MPRKYAKKGLVTPADCDKLIEAIKLVKNNKKSIRSAAAACEINYVTLSRYIRKINEKFPNFAEVTDNELLAFLTSKSALGGKPVS